MKIANHEIKLVSGALGIVSKLPAGVTRRILLRFSLSGFRITRWFEAYGVEWRAA